jgi:hypothetical protein
MIGKCLLETVFDNITKNYKCTNPEVKMITFDVLRIHLKKAFNTKYHEGKDKEN